MLKQIESIVLFVLVLFSISLNASAQTNNNWPKKYELSGDFYLFDEQIYKYGEISNFIAYGADRELMLQVDCQKKKWRALFVSSGGFFRSYPDGDEMSSKYVIPGAFKSIEANTVISEAFPIVCAKVEAKWELIDTSKYKDKTYVDVSQIKRLWDQVYAVNVFTEYGSYMRGLDFSLVGAPRFFEQHTELFDCANNRRQLLNMITFDAEHNISDFESLSVSFSPKYWREIKEDYLDLIKIKELVCRQKTSLLR